MKIILFMLLLFASLSFSYESLSQDFETSSEIEFNQEQITTADWSVTIHNFEILPFNEELVLVELDCPTEVLIVLKHPYLGLVSYNSYARPLIGFYNNLRPLSVYLAIDKYVTMG